MAPRDRRFDQAPFRRATCGCDRGRAFGRAAVYVLGKSGYVKVRDSQNGFTKATIPPPCRRH